LDSCKICHSCQPFCHLSGSNPAFVFSLILYYLRQCVHEVQKSKNSSFEPLETSKIGKPLVRCGQEIFRSDHETKIEVWFFKFCKSSKKTPMSNTSSPIPMESQPNETINLAETLFLESGHSRQVLFCLCVGLTSGEEEGSTTPLLDVDEQPWKSLPRTDVKPTREALAREVARRAAIQEITPLPRPKNWSKDRSLRWLNSNPISDKSSIEFLKKTVSNLKESLEQAQVHRPRASQTPCMFKPNLCFLPQKNFPESQPDLRQSFSVGRFVQIRSPSTAPTQQSNKALLFSKNSSANSSWIL